MLKTKRTSRETWISSTRRRDLLAVLLAALALSIFAWLRSLGQSTVGWQILLAGVVGLAALAYQAARSDLE